MFTWASVYKVERELDVTVAIQMWSGCVCVQLTISWNQLRALCAYLGFNS